MGTGGQDDESYSVCFREAEGGLVFRYKYAGVTLHADRMEWTGEIGCTEPYASIDSIKLTIGFVPRSGAVANCRIGFRDMRILNVTSTSPAGLPDDDRSAAYAAFVHDLHGRLSQSDRSRIVFHAGNSPAREAFGRVTLVIAAAFFIALPLGLFFITGEWKALGLMLVGGAFVVPLWNTLQKNRPRSYDPVRIDEDLFP